jgi:two-component system KDP operon response regulator KdpE
MATVAALKRLAGRLNGLLGREEEDGREEVITAGDFRIDLTNHRVQVRGQRVELTGAEFDLLVFLVSHPKRVITSRTLLATRYNERQVRQTEVLPILLGLRKKLEASGASTHYIRIEPWIFYRFDPAR